MRMCQANSTSPTSCSGRRAFHSIGICATVTAATAAVAHARLTPTLARCFVVGSAFVIFDSIGKKDAVEKRTARSVFRFATSGGAQARAMASVKKWGARYPSLEQAIQATAPIVATLREHPTFELEARFGGLAAGGNKFCTGVSRAMIDSVIEMMGSSSHMTAEGDWDEEQDFLFSTDSAQLRTRVSYCSETMSVRTATIEKRQAGKATFWIAEDSGGGDKSGPNAIRVSLKEERPVANVPACVTSNLVRIKQRRRFTTADRVWAFDFSITWSGANKTEAERNQAEREPMFEIECELINPAQTLALYDDAHIATSLLLKMQQLLGDSTATLHVLR